MSSQSVGCQLMANVSNLVGYTNLIPLIVRLIPGSYRDPPRLLAEHAECL